jgi:formylglycine-generating enzyme required for sulfatase activity
MNRILAVAAVLALLCLSAAVQADVLNMGSGLTSLETVLVGDPGNAGELSGGSAGGYGFDDILGDVGYTYQIGKYEVTTAQYTEFLNAVAKTDTYGLYNPSMWTSSYGCKVQRTGTSGNYIYSVATDWANRPVNYVSWLDTARFANWMANGQPTSLQDLTTTEDGSYYLNGTSDPTSVTRKPDATWVIPGADEWYKAAYYDPEKPGGPGYWDYPTRSDILPSNILGSPTDPGNTATVWSNGTYTIGSPYWRTEVGAHENSASYYGTFDQGGNVEEWTEALFNNSVRGLVGGSFVATGLNMRSIINSYGSPSYEDGDIGFRLGLVPEPSSLMAFFGGLGMLLGLRRRRR